VRNLNRRGDVAQFKLRPLRVRCFGSYSGGHPAAFRLNPSQDAFCGFSESASRIRASSRFSISSLTFIVHQSSAVSLSLGPRMRLLASIPPGSVDPSPRTKCYPSPRLLTLNYHPTPDVRIVQHPCELRRWSNDQLLRMSGRSRLHRLRDRALGTAATARAASVCQGARI
jgi:hypothetical protein